MTLFKKVFSYDGKFMEFLRKTGELIILSVVFLVCCIPVITLSSSVASLYYSVIKSVRRNRGTALGEFFSSMKRTLPKGCLITFEMAVWFAALYFGRNILLALDTDMGKSMSVIYLILMTASLGVIAYIFPILSRFEMKVGRMWKLAFVMCIRFFPITVALVVGTVLLGWAQFYIFPMACILLLPGVWCFIITFMMERALLAYMPKPEEDDDSWYYEGIKTDKQNSGNRDDAEKR